MRTYQRHFRSLSILRFFRWLIFTTILITLIFNGSPRTVQAAEHGQLSAGQGTIRVIVTLNVATQPEGELDSISEVETQQENITDAQDALLNELPLNSATINMRLVTVPVLGLEVNQAALDHLMNSPRVASVKADTLVYPTLGSSVPAIDGDLAWALGYEGTGRTVAILDSGVEATHPFFGGRVVHEACFSTTNEADATTSLCPNGQHTQTGAGAASPAGCADAAGCEHGTHVAGIAAGNGDSFDGVARSADIVAIQVLSKVNAYPQCVWMVFGIKCLAGYESDLMEALEYVYNNREASFPTLDAVNLSLGGGTYTDVCDVEFASFKTIIDNLKSVGVATIVASGNDFNTNATAFPACISTAITVGATDDNDNVASFSNSDTWLDLWAPGVEIESSSTGGSWTILEGTSMAAPHVSGAWAVYRQAHPTDTVDEVLAAFQATGPQISAPNVTAARIDLDTAITGPCFTLTAAANPLAGGAITINTVQNCLGGYTPGTNVSITAVTNEGYTFSNWSGAASGSSVTTNVLMNSNKSVTANFSENCYMLNTITSPVAGGSVALNTAQNCSGGYKHGTVVSITASPNPGHTFASWSGNASGTNATTDVTMDSNKVVTANFALNCYTLSAGSNPPTYGSVMVNTMQNCSGGYTHGTIVMLTANPASGYLFKNWSGDAAGTANPVNVTMLGNRAVTANFGIFADVPVAGKEWMQPWIEQFYQLGITGGCGSNPLTYCPEREVNRAEMAVFIVRALHYPSLPYTPTDPDDHFDDVPVAGMEWMRPWIEEFYDLGISSGCAINPLRFCPEREVTRAEMAVFLLRAVEGSSYQPPAASGYFDDVPVAGKEWMEPWIDELYRRGITGGCGANPLIYCPEREVTRAEMAVFILRAFDSLPNP